VQLSLQAQETHLDQMLRAAYVMAWLHQKPLLVKLR
jgi:hypothetical protein